MIQPEIIYVPEKGKIYDFFSLLNNSTKVNDLSILYNDIGIILDDEIRASYTRLFSAIQNENNDLLKLLFSCSDNGYSFFSTFKNDLMESNNIEEYINRIYNFNFETFPIKILSYLDAKNNLNEKFYQNILSNKDMLFTYLDNINLTDKNKWTFIRFLENPKPMLDTLYSVFYTIKSELDIEYKILRDLREKNYTAIKSLIDNTQYDMDKLKKALPIDRPEYTGIAFERINIYVITYLPYTFQAIWNNRTLNLYLGFNYNKHIYSNNNTTEDISIIFKAFSDETRNRIINIVCEKPNIGFGDIGKELEMPLSSLAHHLDIIVEAGILSRFNEGKKTFFIVNNDGLDKAIKILTSKKTKN